MQPNKRIMIVEDDTSILEGLRELFESTGYAVSCAQNGRAALELLQDQTLPQLIILDLMMPVMDGFQFRIEQERDSRIADIPIVVMSADSQIDSQSLKIGIRHVVRKPVDLDNLLNMVERVSN